MKKLFQYVLICSLCTCHGLLAEKPKPAIGYAAKNGRTSAASITWAAIGISLILAVGIATVITIYKD